MKNRIGLIAVCVSALAFLGSETAIAETTVSWKEIRLVGAKGVPSAKVHKYSLNGIIRISVGPSGGFKAGYRAWADISAKYDKNKNLATEKMILTGDSRGALSVKFRCLKDPWISNTSCVLISAAFAPSGASKVIPNWDKIYRIRRKPLTTSAVSLNKAKQLSKNSAPPPPPPPPAKKKRPMVKFTNPRIIATPDVIVSAVGHQYAKTCKKNARILVVKVAIKNVSSKPLKNAGKKFMVLLKDLSPAKRLHSSYITSDTIPPKQTVWLQGTMAYYGKPSALAGTVHTLELVANPLKIGGEIKFSNNSKKYQFKFPYNFCRPLIKKLPLQRKAIKR